MKSYIIWLKSGECISGVAKEETLEDMQREFENYYSDEVRKVIFKDEDGSVVVDLSRVEAIAINKQPEKNTVGF